jgi:hypothetical protein
MTLQWVDVLVRSCALGVHVVGVAAASSASQSTRSQGTVGEFYLALWQQVVSVLDTILAAEHTADLTIRSRCDRASEFLLIQ